MENALTVKAAEGSPPAGLSPGTGLGLPAAAKGEAAARRQLPVENPIVEAHLEAGDSAVPTAGHPRRAGGAWAPPGALSPAGAAGGSGGAAARGVR